MSGFYTICAPAIAFVPIVVDAINFFYDIFEEFYLKLQRFVGKIVVSGN